MNTKRNTLSAAAVLLALGTASLSASLAPGQTPSSGRDRSLFDFDWKFHPGEVDNGQAPALDDAAWERVDLPHDFMIEGKGQAITVPGGRSGRRRGGRGRGNQGLPTEPEGPFDPGSPGRSGNGYLNGGIGWYRKTFIPPAEAASKRVFVEFEGVYMNSEVWLNGERLGSRPYGYSTFWYDLTPRLKSGAPNVLAVRVLVQQPSSRWYSGAGIYRHTWLTTTNALHIDTWGLTVTTPEITDARAQVRVRTEVANDAPSGADAEILTIIRDSDGREVARGTHTASAAPKARVTASVDLAVDRPHRWSIADPYLYTVESHVRVGGQDVDIDRTPLGIRTIAFTPEGGFLLNGVHVPLQGVCLHHDLGPLGAAAFDRGIERELQIMKELGSNTIRTSHNPPAPALLDAADRLGFVVLDEAFDEWRQNKTRFGYGQFFDDWSERDIRDMVRRDRNHPSVIMWSIGNEIPEQRNPEVAEQMAARLAGFVREEDATRPVTSAMNNPSQALETGFAKPLDLFGVNYNLQMYERVRGSRAFASETSSNYSSRDQYNLQLTDGQVQIVNQLDNHTTSYDLDFPRWGNTAEREFQALAAAPWMAGEFVWTGFDYIGEPTPFNWPNRSSSFGIVDLTGFPKDRFYLYRSKWRPEPMVHLLPHWNWPDAFRGKEIPVWAYTNADSVELLLNGRSLGTRDWTGVAQTHLTWQVPYEPGTLRAVARRSGRTVAEDTVETTGPPARLELVADRRAIAADGQDLAYVTVRVTDAQGRLCRAAGDPSIAFSLTGPGSIAGVGNGDPTNHEPFTGPTRTTAAHRAFNGQALAILRAPRTAGAMTLTARASDLAPASVTITVR